MPTAAYKVVPHEDGWGVEHDGSVSGPYATKEAAFESAVGPASNAIKLGHDVRIEVPGSRGGPSLGAP